MYSLALLVIVLVGLLISWSIQRYQYNKRLDKIKIRVYVNGIRGKSTVTRLIAGVLREAGYNTVGKTTGSAARVILPNGDETRIIRPSAPTIMELMNIVERNTNQDTEAIVFETMALQPRNQKASQELLVKGNISVITNVREDHQDVMGETLEEIADTMSLTIPYDGTLITAEDRPHLRERLAQNAARRNSTLLYADPAKVTDRDIAGFEYLSFKENVAIGLAVAELLGIPRNIAMRGMWNSRPDIGVVSIQRTQWKGKRIIWAPLFAVNDKESTVISMQALSPLIGEHTTTIGILNNRYDRADRAMRFADIAAIDVPMDYWLTFGAYEQQVTERMISLGFPAERIVNLGFSVNPTLEQIFDKVHDLIREEEGILVGMVNIHTDQAELLMEYFAHQPDSPIFFDDDTAWAKYRPRNEVLQEYMERYAPEL